MNFFLLGDDPGLARFVDAVARRNGGRVLTPEPSRLGEYVVADYLRARRGRRSRRTRIRPRITDSFERHPTFCEADLVRVSRRIDHRLRRTPTMASP